MTLLYHVIKSYTELVYMMYKIYWNNEEKVTYKICLFLILLARKMISYDNSINIYRAKASKS